MVSACTISLARAWARPTHGDTGVSNDDRDVAGRRAVPPSNRLDRQISAIKEVLNDLIALPRTRTVVAVCEAGPNDLLRVRLFTVVNLIFLDHMLITEYLFDTMSITARSSRPLPVRLFR